VFYACLIFHPLYLERLSGRAAEEMRISKKRRNRMLESIYRRAALGFLVAFLASCLPLAAQAGTINIILSDMDVTYMGDMNGGTLFDAMGGHSGGTLAEGTADNISTAVFERDNSILGTLINTAADGDDIHVDLRIDGIGPTVTKNVFLPLVGSNGNMFGLDFFTDDGDVLRLTTNQVQLFVSDNVFFFSGTGTVTGTQNLPFGIAPLLPTVQFSFTATLPAVPVTPTIGSALGSGALTISGVEIPEPGSVVLSCVGLIAAGVGVVRRPVRNRR
jgi:hypothetical protein